MKKIALSAIIVVRNEERNIRQCLDSLRWLDEIVVIDQSSDDNTVNICREYTDKIFVVDAKGYCEPDRALAASRAKNDWVLYLDADEVIPAELKDEIVSVLAKKGKPDSYYIPLKNYFLGEWIRGSGWYPRHVLRLFDKRRVRFSDSIHVAIEPLTVPGHMKNYIHHYTCDVIDDYLYKINSYTTILATEAYNRGERITRLNAVSNFIVKPFVYSANLYFLKAGFRDRFNGFFIAFLTFLTVFMKYAKLWEFQKKE